MELIPKFINISHKRDLTGKIHTVSSEDSELTSVFNILGEEGFWRSRKSDENISEYIIVDYQKSETIDYIELYPSSQGPSVFPEDFRFEASLDGNIWMIIHSERNFELETPCYRLDIPLTEIRYLKILISSHRSIDSHFFSEIGRLIAGVAGIQEIKASSTSSKSAGVDNLFTDNPDQYWESELKSKMTKESLTIDMGKIFHINRIVLGSHVQGFPENFYIETSSDSSIWVPLLEEKNFYSQTSKLYFWNTDITPARYIRIEAKGVRFDTGKYGVLLSHLEISAAPFNPLHTHNIGDLTPYSSIFQAGIVRLAKDGEDSPGTAVQGSDRRLRDATQIFKGIVQFADDSDDSELKAVQASDSRLKTATEMKSGIVRLAYDRETNAGAAVQGNDSRIREATDESFGIVKLCPDGQYNEKSVLTGNDKRLHKASEKSFGICRLAKDGADTQGAVVQANDRRLRDATTTQKGIIKLAEDGEDKPDIAVQGNDRRLKDATTTSKGIVELAENGEESPGVAVQGSDKRLKEATEKAKGIVELAEDGEERPGVAVQGNDRRLKDATTAAKGIVRLAEDGEESPVTAVQGSDKRLRTATTEYRGIVELAEDGEDRADVAVQGNDKRLKNATAISRGIVELAEDGEESPGVVVQGSDKRLKDATEESKGIVRLAKDGEDRSGVAVQGNDKRLKDATTEYRGIVELAEDGEDKADVAVQGNDRRLKDATTTSKGIVELAEDGEDKPGVAVQGNDKRLKKASENSSGIVELAEDGEESPGVAVQGNDKRLKRATESSEGIVRLAKNNESRPELAVQSNDDRLSDARTPLEHNHDYAQLDHPFNSHSGTISVTGSQHDTFQEVTPPSSDSAIIYAKNRSPEDGSIAVAGITGIESSKNGRSYGIVGHSGHVGIRGQSAGSGESEERGCGVLGISRFGAGGVFSSEHHYSLVVDGFGRIQQFDRSLNLMGNGDALYVSGRSQFNGQIALGKTLSDSEGDDFPVNITELFEVDETEYISPGDLLVAHEEGNAVLCRSRTQYNRAVIGIVSGNPSFVINNSGLGKKVYPVILAGKALCKVDARDNPINPGDLIVTSNTPGCGMSGKVDSFEKIGTVIGKSLGKLEDGIGVIPVFIAHC